MSLLTKLDFQWEIDSLLKLLDTVEWDSKDRCDLNRPTGHWLYDSYEVREEWRNTEFERLLSAIPYPIGEARLMRLQPGTCYCAHADIDDRYHLNLISSEQSYLIDLTDQQLYKLNTDGYLYKMDAGRVHTAVNWGSVSRVQLVIRIPLSRYDDLEFVRKTIVFKNPTFNFRYIFDSEISPLLNRAVKEQKLGFFNPQSETKIELYLDKNLFNDILGILKNLNKEIEVYD